MRRGKAKEGVFTGCGYAQSGRFLLQGGKKHAFQGVTPSVFVRIPSKQWVSPKNTAAAGWVGLG